MGATYWGDTPIYSGLYYNNERPIGVTLSRLLKREYQEEIILIKSDSPSVADGALIHLASMLSEIRESNVDVFWYAAYPNSDFRDLGLSLRRFLIDIWRRNDIKIIGDREFSALSFEISNCSSPFEYFRKNIQALSTRIGRCEILIVLDLQELLDKSEVNKICSLAKHFLATAACAWKGCVALVCGDEGDSLPRITAPEPMIAPLIEISRTGLRFEHESNINSESLFSESASLVHPLIALNQPIQRRVLDYIVRHAPGLQNELTNLLEREVLWRLSNDRFRVSPVALEKYREQDEKISPPFIDVVKNGARILSFQSPDRLSHQFSSLLDIEKMAHESVAIIDGFATAVAKRVHGENPSAALSFLSEIISPKAFLAAGEMNSRSLLFYASQMLLTGYASFGIEFFTLFERLTYGYADYIQLTYERSDSKNYEASRWVTNLGYVYDELKKNNFCQPSIDRSFIYNRAATYLSNISPGDKIKWAEVRYSEAWQLLDSGRKDESIRVFEDTAIALSKEFQTSIIGNGLLKIMAQELYVASLVIAPNRAFSHEMQNALWEIIDDYGSSLQLDFIRASFERDDLIIEAPRQASVDTTIVSSYFDMHIAMLIAQGLRRQWRRIPKIILASGNSSALKKHNFELHIEGDLVLVIGAPDSPGVVGDFISKRDPELVRLYQMRLLENFGAVIEVLPGSERSIFFLSACGLIGNLYAWHSFIERHCNSTIMEKKQMEYILLKDLLLIPLATAFETRVFNAVADGLLSKLRGKQRDKAGAILQRIREEEPERREKLIKELEGDLQATLIEMLSNASLAQALSEAMNSLRTIDLDLNELLSVADFSYQVAYQLQCRSIPASSEERLATSFVIGFRQQRQEISGLREAYLANPRLDAEKMNMCAENLTKTLRNFQDAAKRMGN